MYDLTASAWDLGLVGLMQFIPSLLLVLVAGHVLDRHHRARILAACIALQAGVALALGMAAWQGWASRELLLALSLLIGTAKAFQLPAQQAITPLQIGPEDGAFFLGRQIGEILLVDAEYRHALANRRRNVTVGAERLGEFFVVGGGALCNMRASIAAASKLLAALTA